MKRNKAHMSVLYSYIGREFLKAFIVSFIFFFFIFFINQILVLAKKIMLKDVDIASMINLVFLYIPQFLLYTFPFSTLSGACMVIGNLESGNEILAMRSSGINTIHIFLPILVLSIFFSFLTLWTSNNLIPVTGIRYRKEYNVLLQRLPTMELNSFTTVKMGNEIISCGKVQDGVVNNIQIFDDEKVISADTGTVQMIDIDNYIYKIELSNPVVLLFDRGTGKEYQLARSDNLVLYLNFSTRLSSISNVSASQYSLVTLQKEIDSRKGAKTSEENNRIWTMQKNWADIAYLSSRTMLPDFSLMQEKYNSYTTAKEHTVSDFYYQYYKSEFYKKISLSLACIVFVFIAFPLSFFRLKYGRLTGFGLSIFIAAIYWFLIFYAQVNSVRSSYDPALMMLLPDLLIFLTGIILIQRLKKN